MNKICGNGKQDRWMALAVLLTAVLFGGGFLSAYPQRSAVLCSNTDLLMTQALRTALPEQTAQKAPAEKIVCLTFDDGPSKNTEKVLTILKKEQVPATFFVIAAENNKTYLPLVQEEQRQGHQVALHSCTHEYKEIYQSPEAYWEDIERLKEQLNQYVDAEKLTYLRFPGGSTNTVSRRYGGSEIMKELKLQAEQKGYCWVDWNVCANDAVGGHPSANEIYRQVVKEAEGRTQCVVLMHDTKATGTTVEALPDIIAWFREQGYTFATVQTLNERKAENAGD